MANSYCDKAVVKDRLLIASADTSYDTALDQAIAEASRMIDIFLKPYTSIPIPDAGGVTTADAQIQQITGDFSASIFKRRMVPNEVTLRGSMLPNAMDIVSEMDASGWFAIGIRKLELYIKSFYTLAETIGITVHNPDIWINLLQKGVITGKEAREGIKGVSDIALKQVENLDKTIVETRTETLTKTDSITATKDLTETQYVTKKQKSFAFVESDENGEYKEQE